MTRANKTLLNIQQQFYRNENTEVYINCVRSMPHVNERWQYTNKQRKLFYIYEKNYKEKDSNYRRNNYNHIKNNYTYNNTKCTSHYINNKNYFSVLSKSQFTNLHKTWKMQIPMEVSKSRSCSAVFDYHKLYPFKTCETAFPAYRKTS